MSELNHVKNSYEVLAKKYKLVSFASLNENFEIDKIDKETYCLLRLVRKVMMEKILNSLSFLELLLNPVNSPRIYLSYIRTMTLEDKKEIELIYGILGELSVLSLDLEIDYSEKKEAEMIRKISTAWNEVKPRFRKILDHMKKPNGFSAVKKEKSYFG